MPKHSSTSGEASRPTPPAGRRDEPGQPGREFGRDGLSGLVTGARALRAREVSSPTPEDLAAAEEAADALLDRALRRPPNRGGGRR